MNFCQHIFQNRCLNMTSSPHIVLAIFNPLGQRRTTVTKLCLTSDSVTVTPVDGNDNEEVPTQINPLSAGVSGEQYYVVSTTWCELEFAADLDPLQVKFFHLKLVRHPQDQGQQPAVRRGREFVKIRSHYKMRAVSTLAVRHGKRLQQQPLTTTSANGGHDEAGGTHYFLST